MRKIKQIITILLGITCLFSGLPTAFCESNANGLESINSVFAAVQTASDEHEIILTKNHVSAANQTEGILIVAGYNAMGRLKKAEIIDGYEKELTGYENCKTMKAFLWYNTNKMKPLCNSAEYTNDIYVTVDGDDVTGDGSKEKPYATLDKARQRARELNSEMNVTVHIGEGKYFIDKPVRFDAEDSNVKYLGEGAVLTGAKPLSGLTWSNYNNNIKVADTEKNLDIDQLFINSEQQTMARYPNYDENAILQGSTSKANIKERSKNYKNPSGGYIRALHDKKWGGNSYKITGKNSSDATGLSYEWVGDNARGSGMHNDCVMVENIFEELDSPGEWYYDKTNGKLYIYPKSGTDLDSSVIEAAVTEELLHIEGTKDVAQVENLIFDGITLENTKRTMFTGTYVPLMRSDWCVVRSGALFIQDAENIAFKNGTIQNIGGNGVFVSGHTKDVEISNNEMLNIGSSGIQVVGLPDSCREPSFWGDTPTPEVKPYYVHKPAIEDEIPGPVKEHYPENVVISQNHIMNVGIWEKQSSHVALSVAHNIKILNNTMHVGPRAGVNICDGTFGGHEIAHNDIFDVQKETDDHGMFNSWGRDRWWTLNDSNASELGNATDGAAKSEYKFIDVIDTITIHDNRLHFGGRLDGGKTFGIDLDDGSSNYDIYNNLCLNMGIKLREGFGRHVHNNIFVNGKFELHCVFENAEDLIESNIIIKGGNPYGLSKAEESRFKVSGDTINKNCFYDFGMEISYPDFWRRLGYDNESLTVNPQFKAPASNDYTVLNTTMMEKIGFKNFPMERFGKTGCQYSSPYYEKTKPDGNQQIVLETGEWAGAVISNIDDGIMSSLGAGSLDGVYLPDVPSNSQAAKYGLKTYDIIRAVNGEKIEDIADFSKKYSKLPTGGNVTLSVYRAPNETEITYIKESEWIFIDDQDISIKYQSDERWGSWNWDPQRNIDNTKNCIGNTMTSLCAARIKNYTSSILVEVPFTGTKIEFLGRKQDNMGKYSVQIIDSDGNTVQNAVADAYIPAKQAIDATAVFTSDELPHGNYTLKISYISGDWVVIDAFKIYS